MDAFADYSASRTRNNAPMHVLKPGLLNFTRKATKFRIQSTYENILSDWPVHKHIYNTPNQPNTVRDTEETEEPRPGPSSRQVRPDPLRSKTRARHQRQKTTISSDEDISEEMQDCEQVHDDTEEEPTPPTTRQGRERNITKYTSRHQRPHEDEDDEDPRPDPSYQPQGRDEQRSHHHRRNRLQDSDQIRGQDSAEGRRLGPCSRLPRKDQTKSKKRSREQRRVGIPESDEDSCNRMDENTENECPETRQPCQSNKARKTVKRGSKPRSQHLGNKVLEDEQSDYTEKPGRLARAAAIKAADKIKETQHSDKNYSWIGPASSSDSGEHDVSVYKPEKKRSRK
ncbi:unnamed protein product [Orchesella dallaii]|uniref:Uncharacterized protein n=1 Tax=Orchesella dallaii TaxID=48710 RepID=A0ABP1PUN7_9HEXA